MIQELRRIGEQWGIPLLTQAADEITALRVANANLCQNNQWLSDENTALKLALDALTRERRTPTYAQARLEGHR